MKQTNEPESSLSLVARAHGLSAAQLFEWRKAYLEGSLVAVGANEPRVRVAFALDCCDREVMSWLSTTKGIDAALVGGLMMQAVEKRFGSNGKPP